MADKKPLKLRVKNPNEILFYFKRFGIPFLLEQSMFTKKFDSKFGRMEFVNKNSDIKPTDLGFIGQVKRYCEKNSSPFDIDRTKINYIFEGKLKKSINYKKDLFEIDLTKAYWNYCKSENFISEEIYLKGLEVKKKIRLIALGNLAKRTCILNFNGSEYLKPEFRRSDKTEHIFFRVSQLTDNLMQKLIFIADKQFLFYWVDAIFVQGEETKNNICNYLINEGIEHKIIKIDNIIKLDNKIVTNDETHINLKIDKSGKVMNPTGQRTFNFRKTDFSNFIKAVKTIKN